MAITITIGREATTGQLMLNINGQKKIVGTKDSVPRSVSREHVKLCCEDENSMVVENINIENDTYVNGFGIERKHITLNDKIVLGCDDYELDWNLLKPLIPVDISHLSDVWEEFDKKRMAMSIKQQRFNALRMVLFAITGIVATICKQQGLSTGIAVLSALPTALFALYSFRMSGDLPKKQKALQDAALDQYRCPRCGYMFQLQPFKFLSQTKKCPGCGAIFVNNKK